MKLKRLMDIIRSSFAGDDIKRLTSIVQLFMTSVKNIAAAVEIHDQLIKEMYENQIEMYKLIKGEVSSIVVPQQSVNQDPKDKPN